MAAEEILGFLGAIDDELGRHAAAGETLELHLIGRSALVLGFGLRLMTKDVDVVEVAPAPLLDRAAEAFARGGEAHRRLGFYLEVVSSGLPPMPAGFAARCVAIDGPWRVIRPKRPEAHDLIVTKLKRFHAGDREDVRILCDSGEVAEPTLRERFDLAHLFSDPDDPKVIGAAANLDVVAGYLAGRLGGL